MRKQLLAGPGQIIAIVPELLDIAAQHENVSRGAFVCDGLVGHWVFPGDGMTAMGQPVGEDCPLCFTPLCRVANPERPAGRLGYRVQEAYPTTGTRAFMMDRLPDHLDFIACPECQIGFTRSFVKETPDAVAPR